jgi:hypothetical protein
MLQVPETLLFCREGIPAGTGRPYPGEVHSQQWISPIETPTAVPCVLSSPSGLRGWFRVPVNAVDMARAPFLDMLRASRRGR